MTLKMPEPVQTVQGLSVGEPAYPVFTADQLKAAYRQGVEDMRRECSMQRWGVEDGENYQRYAKTVLEGKC